MNINKIHHISGLAITAFVVLHLFNHLMSLYGAGMHIDVMDDLRQIYRNPIIEVILLLAISVQIFTGIRLFLRQRKLANGFFAKLQLWSGLYLAIFFLIHIGAVMMGRYVMHLDTNFYFGVAGLNTFPYSLFFIPYYGLAILSFFGHVAAIHYRKMKKEPFGISVKQQSQLVLIFGCLLTLLIFYGLTDGFSGVEIPQEYEVLIGK